jgi:hypothetical protein
VTKFELLKSQLTEAELQLVDPCIFEATPETIVLDYWSDCFQSLRASRPAPHAALRALEPRPALPGPASLPGAAVTRKPCGRLARIIEEPL